MWTAQTYIDAYLEARRARIAPEAMGTVERAGRHLLESAVRTGDGLPCPAMALQSALAADELEVALEVHEGLIGSQAEPDTSWDGPGRASVSGVIEDAR